MKIEKNTDSLLKIKNHEICNNKQELLQPTVIVLVFLSFVYQFSIIYYSVHLNRQISFKT